MRTLSAVTRSATITVVTKHCVCVGVPLDSGFSVHCKSPVMPCRSINVSVIIHVVKRQEHFIGFTTTRTCSAVSGKTLPHFTYCIVLLMYLVARNTHVPSCTLTDNDFEIVAGHHMPINTHPTVNRLAHVLVNTLPPYCVTRSATPGRERVFRCSEVPAPTCLSSH